MRLVKVKNGKIEANNFYLSSDFMDFVGESIISKDILNGTLNLKSNHTVIERKLNLQEFLILIKKNNFAKIEYKDYSIGYIKTDKGTKYSIKDDIEGQSEYWKLICSEGYMQVYSSDDGYAWHKLGGQKLDGDIIAQGFIKNNPSDFILKNYEVHCSPYVSLNNIPEGYKIIFYDKNNNKIDEKICDDSMQVKVFLNNKIEGYFIIYDKDNKENYKSDVIEFNYGDEYLYSSYELEVVYNGQSVNSNSSVTLQDLYESISIRNADNKIYRNVKLSTNSNNGDLIELSIDGVTFKDILIIPELKATEDKDVIIKITKNANNCSFAIRDFNLNVEVGEIIE